MLRDQLQALELAHVGDHVEHAAPAHVDAYLAQVRHVDFGIDVCGERRYVLEGDSLDLAALAPGLDADQPGRCLQHQLGERLLHRQHAHLQQHGDHRDGVAAGHHRVLDLLHDDVARIGLGVAGRDDDVAAMRRVAARFAQHQLAQLVVVGFEPLHLGVHAVAGDVRHAAGDHAHGGAGVGVDGVDGAFE
ncbi:hypothetical protein D3C85_1288460 [compost metagenome]